MGNQQSRSNLINETINKSATSVILNSSANCGQNNNAIQQLSFSNIKGGDGCNTVFDGISQISVQAPTFTCSSSAENETDLLAKFKTELQQNANSDVSGLAGAVNSESISEVTNKLVNDISNNININSLSNCVQDNYEKQTTDYNNISLTCPAYCNDLGSLLKDETNPIIAKLLSDTCTNKFSNLSQNLVQKSVGECMLSNSNIQKIISDADTSLVQSAESKNSGIDIAEIINSFGLSVFLPLIIIAIVGLVGFYLFSNMTTGTVSSLTGNGPMNPSNYQFSPQGNWSIPPAYGAPPLPPR
jgi:hypothetical protein